jgi:hypothetical protein
MLSSCAAVGVTSPYPSTISRAEAAPTYVPMLIPIPCFLSLAKYSVRVCQSGVMP